MPTWCDIMNLPTRPLALPRPLACLSVAELSNSRGFLCRPGGEYNDACFLNLLLMLVVVVFDPRDTRARLVGQHPRHRRHSAHFGGRRCVHSPNR